MDMETLFELIKANQETTLKKLEVLEKNLFQLSTKINNIQGESSEIIEGLVSAQTIMEEVLYHITEVDKQVEDTSFLDYNLDLKNNSNKSELN